MSWIVRSLSWLGPGAGDRVMPAFQELWPRWRQAVGMASHRGVLCSDRNKGRRVSYTNPRRWLPGFSPAPEDEAIGTVITRYLYAYGPATPQQFAQWIGAPPVWAGEQFERHTRKLTKINFAGISTWAVGGMQKCRLKPTSALRSVLLLLYFDSYVVGSHPRDRLFRERRPAVHSLHPARPATIRSCWLMGWSAASASASAAAHVTVEPLTRFTADQRQALETQAERIGKILGGQARLTVGTVTAGGHA